MNKRFIYGGMATALAVILVTGISFQQLSEQTGGSDILIRGESAVSGSTGAPASAPIDSARTAAPPPKSARHERAAQESMTLSYEGDSAVATMAMPAVPMMEIGPSFAGQDYYQGYYNDHAVSDMIAPYPPAYQTAHRNQFEQFEQNTIKLVSAEPVSTFSIDVDTASYSIMRRSLNSGVLPPAHAVRAEELINYFDYAYPVPENRDVPFTTTVSVKPSPWKDGNKLMHIAIQGYDIDAETRPRANLVLLIDVSGSMNRPDRLPLAINGFRLLLETLSPEDTVAIVTYAGRAGTVLEPTKVAEKAKILNTLDELRAAGSTAGGQGIRQAYQLAENNFDENAVNRVILATDGDFNVGITDREELKDFVARKRDSGIYLSVLGFGMGNLNDHMMQTLAQNGNGVAAYIDTLNEARKVLVEEASSTLFPIANDVKIQVEFNPATVAEYRLIGYETRHLNREDFNNDAVDAGDIGAGHSVTAIYEITPVGGPVAIDESRYAATTQQTDAAEAAEFADEYAYLKIRYKLPGEDTSKLITTPVTSAHETPSSELMARETDWAVAVASFAQLLKGGQYTGALDYDDVIALAQASKGDDEFGYRAEFIQLVRLAKSAAALR